MAGMSVLEQSKLVGKYIGVTPDGYLNGFSYQKHYDFYTTYCDIDINVSEYGTSTRRRFEAILKLADPPLQAKIIRGILDKFPPDETAWPTRTQALHDEFERLASKLEGLVVSSNAPAITSAVVERVIADAEHLIQVQGATSGVDRIHTMMHGYLRAVCAEAKIQFHRDATVATLFRMIREQHPALKESGPRAQDVTTVLKQMSGTMDALTPIRNNASAAHPNDELLDAPEAMLIINSARTLLHYLDTKIANYNALFA